MPSITDLNLSTNNSAFETDGNVPVASDYTSLFTDIEAHVNDSLGDNLVQLAIDCLGSGYAFDSDGLGQYTATLFDKQIGTDNYDAGDISLGTSADVAYASVDATNAVLSFTPEQAGDYRAVFMFTHIFELTATTEGQCEVSFRITDGTSDSFSVRSGGYYPATAANGIRMANPIVLTHIFTFGDTTARTITLQNYNRSMSNVSTNQVSASAADGEIYMMIEKI